ncbi:transcriptional regulator family: Fungal Specific TF [Penicillium psychrosexuale]|uniref:transcriptional regulator family: Fungal Specific TF n=1 Tax=Penicillium psychrosexuale TaxID=1002107 RepID=UPI002545857F|nr:transcriptional regulator family: Fungal Specific TF [Penicillium psychrosexuale]KAJ5783411.1 transcriptional regulator family: Fungal Specific TF [Penicillium psychrosexuale]
MRQSLRRSCDACAKSKSSCDLRTPRCSRCVKRQVECAYANEPSTGPATSGWQNGTSTSALDGSGTLTNYRFGSLDPFDSYPQTRLPREHVQRLIYSFLHKIAFQYYPLDLNATSNPFLISWWPLALGDPALFHVSLQTACLDEELLAQKGFQTSELLMADSVALLRRKVEYMSLAVQDGTMNSVITLATIEFGKGNIKVGEMHVNGLKKLVDMRGGINAVRQTSPLTARMISWVSMLIMGHPQFETQDDFGIGDGIPPIAEWQFDSTALDDQIFNLNIIEVDYAVENVFRRLRNIFRRARNIPFPATQLHDLTCFVIHRLLLSAPVTTRPPPSQMTESIRYGIIIYMFIAQGPTYYSHAVILNTIVIRFIEHLEHLASTPRVFDSLDVWFAAVGMVASAGTTHHRWFMDRARDIAAALQLSNFSDTLVHIKNVLWLEKPQGADLFRSHWDTVFNLMDQSGLSDLSMSVSPYSSSVEFR